MDSTIIFLLMTKRVVLNKLNEFSMASNSVPNWARDLIFFQIKAHIRIICGGWYLEISISPHFALICDRAFYQILHLQTTAKKIFIIKFCFFLLNVYVLKMIYVNFQTKIYHRCALAPICVFWQKMKHLKKEVINIF